MQALPLAKVLKKSILGIYLSALLYNRSAAINYLEAKQITAMLI